MLEEYLSRVNQIDKNMYERFLDALSTGRWLDGELITEVQREHVMLAVIAWGELNLPQEKRVGYIDKGSPEKKLKNTSIPLNWRETKRD